MASTILEKGHNAHQSLKFVYILVALLSVIAIIVVIESFFWNRQVSYTSIKKKKEFILFLII